MNEIFNHLWQSTLFAAAVAIAAMCLRRNSRRLRYWLWLAASVKFLIPFSLIVATGARVHLPPDTPSFHATTVQQVSTYFAPISAPSTAAPTHATIQRSVVFAAIWFAGALFLLLRWFRRWRAIHLTARRATPLPLAHSVPAFSSPTMMEPGVFGVFRPMLLLPQGIADSLTPEQFDAIIAHELCHIRYRDNLTAALHMFVETLFWFHPLVWWIGARLMHERERDCDEAVLSQGSRPGEYARGIVQVCEEYVESPLACAAGISGSDLKKRIREIMIWRGSLRLTFRGKTMLAAAAFVVVSVPFVIGIIRAQALPPVPAYTYSVASIHRADPSETGENFNRGPQGGLITKNTPVNTLLNFAYDVPDYRFAGAPGWVSSERYDIVLTPSEGEVVPAPGGNLPMPEFLTWVDRSRQRLQAVLRDRFRLVLRAEMRELPVYALARAKGSARAPRVTDGGPTFFHNNGKGHVESSGMPMKMLTDFLSSNLGRPVQDQTGLTGDYDYKLDWTPDDPEPSEPSGSTPLGPSIFTALADQLGLRLEPSKGPVQVYVVEKIERPSEN